MAGSLEVAKLVVASLLYQYWDTINKGLRTYLTVAAAVLILITSMGIYGFLSAAYQETANKAGNIDAQIALVEVKRDNIKEQLAVYNTEKESISKSVTDLRAGLAGNVQTYRDKDGNILSTSSSANRKAFEKQLDQAIIRQGEINSKVDELNTQLFEYETEIVNIQTNNDLAGELGPLKYLSGLTGVSMDKIINWLLLIIIFVFDPLAIALVVAANFAFAQLRPKPQVKPEDSNIEHNEGTDFYTEDELKDWDVTLQDGLEEEWDEDHAHSMVLNQMIEDLENESPQGSPIMVDPKTGKLFYIVNEPDITEEETLKETEDSSNQLEIDFPPHEKKPILTEEEKKYDENNDGILDKTEQSKMNHDKMLDNPGISSYTKRKLRNYLEGNTKRYF